MRTERLLELLSLLRSHRRLTARQIADTLHVTERTAYRDVRALEAAGVPISSFGGPGGGFFLDDSYRLSLAPLSTAELRSLFVPTGTTPQELLGLGASAALRKLVPSLTPPQRHEVDRLGQRFYVDPTGWFRSPDGAFLKDLQQAVWEDRVVDLVYGRAGEEGPRRLEAWALVAKIDVWYLVANRVGASPKTMKTYRVSRVRSLSVSEETFVRDADFRAADYWQRSSAAFEAKATEVPLYTVRLRVDPELLWYFPAYLEGRYRIAGTDEGGSVLEVDFDSMDEARSRLAGMGSRVEVLEPNEIREQLVVLASAILGRYGLSEPVREPPFKDPLS